MMVGCNMDTGNAIYQIRRNKGYSQKYVSEKVISQGAYSKFERLNTDISLRAFDEILTRLELSYHEFKFIQNGYRESTRNYIFNLFLNQTYNNENSLQNIIEMSTEYLKHHDDILITDLVKICESLITLRKTNDFEYSSRLLLEVWDRLSKKDVLYIMDLFLLNSILFYFPLKTVVAMKKLAFKSIDRYNGFENTERLKVNIHINIGLLLMRESNYEEALLEYEQAISYCQKYGDYLRLAICYIRKGICSSYLGDASSEWINKGKNILIAIDKTDIFNILEKEIIKNP